MSSERFGGLRAIITAEAARLMYEEGVKQYFTAKRLAAKRILGRVEGRRLRHRPADLPSNGEIREALLLLAERCEGASRTRRLFAMRVVALEVMKRLTPFEPRLIGSVSTGHIRRGSDIDIQVFTDDEDSLEQALKREGFEFERENVTIQKNGQFRDYVHYHLVHHFDVELTAYPFRELGQRPRSSTDGKPIDRVRASRLQKLVVETYPDAWAEYQRTGIIAGLAEALREEAGEEPMPGPYDGLLMTEEEIAGVDEDTDLEDIACPEPGEEDDPEQAYAPLPGFEHLG